jgi:hypothetical protein
MSEDNKTNLQHAVWGLSAPMAGADSNRRTLDLTVESQELIDFIQELDRKNIETAVENCEKWFRKTVDRTTIENMYVPILKQPYKEGAAFTTRVKVTVGDKYATEVWLVGEEEDKLTYVRGSHTDLNKGCKMVVIVESAGLWFMSKQFGCSMNAIAIMVWPNKIVGGINSFVLAPNTKLVEGHVEPMELDD